MKITYYTKFI